MDRFKKFLSLDGRNFFVYSGLVIVAGFLLRFFDIARIKYFVQDEFYYVKDAWSMLKYGYEVKWIPDYDDLPNIPNLLSASNHFFYDGTSPIPYNLEHWSVHGPVGKWMISFGMALFGFDNPVGWRFSAVIAGTLIVALVIIFTQMLLKNKGISILAGAFVAVDGLNVSMSRFSHLDIFLALMVMVSAVLTLYFIRKYNYLSEIKRYLFISLIGISVGLSAAVKWSGAIIILIPLLWLLYSAFKSKDRFRAVNFILRSFVMGLSAVAAYILSFSGWFINYAPRHATGFTESIMLFVNEHIENYKSVMIFSGPSFLKSGALEWITAAHPSVLGSEDVDMFGVTIPNLILWGLGWITIFSVIISIFRNKFNTALLLPLLYVALLIGPWFFYYDRVIYQWYSISFEPFVMIFAAYGLWFLFHKSHLSQSLARFIIWFSAIFFIIFLPANTFVAKNYNAYDVVSMSSFNMWTRLADITGLYNKSQAALYSMPNVMMQEKNNPDKTIVFMEIDGIESFYSIPIVSKDTHSEVYNDALALDTSELKEFDMWEKTHPNLKIVTLDDHLYAIYK